MYNPNHEHSHPYVNRMKKDAKDPHRSIAKIYKNDPSIHGGVFQGKLFPEGGVDPTAERWSFNLGPKINESLPCKRSIPSDTPETLADRIKQKRLKENEEKLAAAAFLAQQKALEQEIKAKKDAENAAKRLAKKKQKEEEEKLRVQEEKKRQMEIADRVRAADLANKKKAADVLKEKKKQQAELEANREALLKIAQAELVDPEPEEQSCAKVSQNISRASIEERERALKEREEYDLKLKDLEKREREFNERIERDRRERESSTHMERSRQQSQQPNQQMQQMHNDRTPLQQYDRMRESGYNRQTPSSNFYRQNMYDSPGEMYPDTQEGFYDRPVAQSNHANYSRELAYPRGLHSSQRPYLASTPANIESHNGISFVFNTNNYQTSNNTLN